MDEEFRVSIQKLVVTSEHTNYQLNLFVWKEGNNSPLGFVCWFLGHDVSLLNFLWKKSPVASFPYSLNRVKKNPIPSKLLWSLFFSSVVWPDFDKLPIGCSHFPSFSYHFCPKCGASDPKQEFCLVQSVLETWNYNLFLFSYRYLLYSKFKALPTQWVFSVYPNSGYSCREVPSWFFVKKVMLTCVQILGDTWCTEHVMFDFGHSVSGVIFDLSDPLPNFCRR